MGAEHGIDAPQALRKSVGLPGKAEAEAARHPEHDALGEERADQSASLRSRYSSRKTFTCSCQAWPVRYSRTMSCARLEWHSTAASAASTSLSLIPGGARAQPTRSPGNP